MTDRARSSHLRVLDLSRLQPGAFCTGVLADLGADVLRIEPPGGGDPLRMLPGAPAAYHRGKRAMTLDLKHDARAARSCAGWSPRSTWSSSRALPAALRQQGIGYEPARGRRSPGWCGARSPGSAPTARTPTAPRTTSRFLGYSGLLALMAGDTVPPTPDFVLAVPYRRADRRWSASSPRCTDA